MVSKHQQQSTLAQLVKKSKIMKAIELLCTEAEYVKQVICATHDKVTRRQEALGQILLWTTNCRIRVIPRGERHFQSPWQASEIITTAKAFKMYEYFNSSSCDKGNIETEKSFPSKQMLQK